MTTESQNKLAEYSKRMQGKKIEAKIAIQDVYAARETEKHLAIVEKQKRIENEKKTFSLLIEMIPFFCNIGGKMFPVRDRAWTHPVSHKVFKIKSPQSTGWQKTSTDSIEQMRKWWLEGIRSFGVRGGTPLLDDRGGFLFIVDCDITEKPDGTTQNGWDTLQEEALKHGDDFENTTLCSYTPSGGRHFFFRVDDLYRNSTSTLFPSVDTRGYGGYVVMPGSRLYTDNTDLDSESGQAEYFYNRTNGIRDIAPLPAWLQKFVEERTGRYDPEEELLKAKARTIGGTEGKNIAGKNLSSGRIVVNMSDMGKDFLSKYPYGCYENNKAYQKKQAMAHLDEWIEEIKTAQKGLRNSILYSYSYKIGGMVPRYLSSNEAFELCINAGMVSGLDQSEAEQTVSSAFRNARNANLDFFQPDEKLPSAERFFQMKQEAESCQKTTSRQPGM